jgi:amidase
MSSLAKDTQWLDAVDQAELVRSGKVTPVELLDAAIERAKQLNPAIYALTFTWFDTAREIARNLP